MKTLEDVEHALLKRIYKAEKLALKQGLQIAHKYSQGIFTSKMLRALGHPYAKAHPNPPADPGIVNAQTHEFDKSWKTQLGPLTYEGSEGHLYNDSSHAQYLDTEQYPAGTDLMIPRPLRDLIETELQEARIDLIQKALDNF